MMINTITIAIILFSPGVFLGMQTEATVALTAPSSPPCFGLTYKLTCTHPVLDADTNVRWEGNGNGFNPQSTPNYDLNVNPTPTTTTLTINVTREEFENKVYTYRCFTFDVTRGTSDPNRTISNEVTVDPPEIPLSVSNITYSKTNDSISPNWQHEDVCFDPITYEIKVQNDIKTVSTLNTTNPKITIKELVPNTKYTIAIRAVYGILKSRPNEMMITTLESVKLEQLAGTVGNKTKFLCKHHNRNDKAFSSKLTFWKKNDDEFVEYSDEIVEKQNKQTILSTVAEEGDTIVCALKLKSGEMETSNLVIVKFAERSTSEKNISVPGIVVGILVAGGVIGVISITLIVLVFLIYRHKKCERMKLLLKSNAVANEEATSDLLEDIKSHDNVNSEKTVYAEVVFGQNVSIGNGQPDDSSDVKIPLHSPNEMLDVIYNQACRCCTNGCATRKMSQKCKACDGDRLSDTVLPCGHAVCSVTAKDATECPFCSSKIESQNTISLLTVSLPEKEKKHFCKRCTEVCLVCLCQKCFRTDRPVAFALVCGHQVCETCRVEEEKCSYCNEEKMIKLI